MEIEIVRFLNEFGKGTIIDSISWLISYWPFIIFVSLLLFFWVLAGNKNDKSKYKLIIISLIIALALNFLITNFLIKTVLVDFIGIRERPYLAYNFINAIGSKSISSSFPSSHMSTLVALAGVLAYFYRKRNFQIFLGIFIFLMAFSRIHNGMHYLSDVLAGVVLGIAYCFVAVYLSRRLLGEERKK